LLHWTTISHYKNKYNIAEISSGDLKKPKKKSSKKKTAHEDDDFGDDDDDDDDDDDEEGNLVIADEFNMFHREL
jgi:hypothetical protein